MKKKRKKNKRGFTFIELLSAIVILSVLMTVGVVTVTRFLESSKEKYYRSQEDLITLAGKQYFTDYRSQLPKEVGTKNSVTLETLYAQKYLDRVKDYNGKVCEGTSDDTVNRVYAMKTASGKYQYYTVFKCSDYLTKVDNKAPVITFTPSSANTKEDVNVTMKITDNVGVDSFYYEIIKDGVISKKTDPKTYTDPVTITIKDEGTYIIKGHATDKRGNTIDKNSKEYVIDKTTPDCSKFIITSTNGSIKEKWQSKDAKLKITPPTGINKWDFERCFTASDNKTEVCIPYGTGLTGTSSKVLKGSEKFYISNDILDIDNPLKQGDSKTQGETTYKDNGHFYGRIKAYDKAGNSCTTKTDTYYIDKDVPIIKEKIVNSKSNNYNSLEAYIHLSIEDRVDKTDNNLYYMISSSSDFKGASWQNYNEGTSGYQNVDWRFSGNYDGQKRTLYIKVKDELNNISDVYTMYYTVYKECESKNLTSSVVRGSCSGSCGNQKITITTTNKDINTNKQCSVTNGSESCSTDECNAPSCSFSVSGGTAGNNDWYRGGTVTYTLNTNSATKTFGINGYNSTKSGTVSSNGKYTFTGYAKNAAGVEATCSLTIKYDSTAPTCTHNTERTTWSNENKRVYKGCADTGGSGCVRDYYADAVIDYTKRIQNFSAYTISDNAGNTRDCPDLKLKIYVDKDAPSVVARRYNDYRGSQCKDDPSRLYKYRYNVSMSDGDSGLKETTCTWAKPKVTRSGANIRNATIIENLCQDTKGISCRACDYAGNCRTVSKD